MNNIFSLPPQIQYILQTLEEAGHEAYLVGGCVRDALLGKTPYDFDICTSALPQQTMALFDRTVPTGIAHGTVTVLYEGETAEVTVFRREGTYSDHRRPDAVTFTDSLTEDLARRDFTVNAIAMDRRGQLRDPFGGCSDLEAGLLRCVGDPHARFREDALRMFRCLRFSAQLGFAIHPDTLSALRANAGGGRFVAPERSRTELEKTLLSPRPRVLEQAVALGLAAPMIPPGACDLHRLELLPALALPRWTALIRALMDAGLVTDPEATLRSLRLDKHTLRAVTGGIAAAAAGLPEDRTAMKQLLRRVDDDTAQCAMACGNYDGLTALRDDILKQNEPCRIGHLAVGGGDLTKLGLEGTRVGAVLNRLLDAVIEDPTLNAPAPLLKLAAEEARRS